MKNLQLIISFICILFVSNWSFSGTYSDHDSTYTKVKKTAFYYSILDGEKEKKKKEPTTSGRIAGLKIGGGTANIINSGQFQQHKAAFFVGLSKEFLLTKVIGISVEGNYWLTGFVNDTVLTKVSFNYLSVPVMLNVNIASFYFAVGMYGALNLRTSERIGNSARLYYGFQNNKYGQWDWGAVFNIGFKWRFLGFDVRYVMGLQDVLKQSSGSYTNSALFFGASLHLMRKKK